MTIISKEAWRERFAQRVVNSSPLGREFALKVADAHLSSGNVPIVPEDAADQQMLDWVDDEGQID